MSSSDETKTKLFSPIILPDESRGLDTSKSIYPSEYEGHFGDLLLTRKEILNRIEELAQLLHAEYVGTRPVLLCVLKGASPFFHCLLEALQGLKQGYEMEFLRVSSYQGTNSTGSIQVKGGMKVEQLEGKNVIVVEDIVDTGGTLSKLIPHLKEKGQPKSVEACTLITRRIGKPAMYEAKFVGFSAPNHFMVGFGLDYNEYYRDVQDIWVISKQGIDFGATT